MYKLTLVILITWLLCCWQTAAVNVELLIFYSLLAPIRFQHLRLKVKRYYLLWSPMLTWTRHYFSSGFHTSSTSQIAEILDAITSLFWTGITLDWMWTLLPRLLWMGFISSASLLTLPTSYNQMTRITMLFSKRDFTPKSSFWLQVGSHWPMVFFLTSAWRSWMIRKCQHQYLLPFECVELCLLMTRGFWNCSKRDAWSASISSSCQSFGVRP